jgi:hypothetical protein
VLGLVALLAGCGQGHHAAPETNEHAFVDYLASRHPGFDGPSFCQSQRSVEGHHAPICIAELHNGSRYLQVWVNAVRGSVVSFKHVSTGAWIRRWSGYARPSQDVSPGLISVNASDALFDWRWLILGVDGLCRQKHRDSCSASALDGPYGGSAGFAEFYDFNCHKRGAIYLCRNKLGDAVRWRPRA